MLNETPSANGGQNDFNSFQPAEKAFFQISLFQNKTDNQPQLVGRSWKHLCAKFQTPEIRRDKDGLLFSGATFEPAVRRKQNVKELSLLGFDVDHNADFDEVKRRFDLLKCAYAIHSTHSHLRVTDKNPNAEPRFRVVVPLLKPIPAADFPNLWQFVKATTALEFDENAKDASRMFYAPAIADKNAHYICHIQTGAFLNWEKIPLDGFNSNDQTNTATAEQINNSANSANSFASHDERHLELCRRIETQGKNTGRGGFEMKCPAHNGSGNTSLFYDSKKGAVACLKKPNPCSYFEILRAFGLSDERLTSQKRAEGAQQNGNEAQPLRVVRMFDVKPEQISWLWFPYIALGKVTLLSGFEGLGKSWITCALAAGITTGAGFPVIDENGRMTFQPCEAGNVLMLSAEDGLGDTIRPRLDACGADTTRVFCVDEPLTFDEKGLFKLETAIAEFEPCLVTIDPIFAFTPAKTDINAANHARAISSQLARIAEKYKCAILLIRHIGKAKGNGEGRAAGLGSIDWRAAARSELFAVSNPENESEKAIVQDKNNLERFGAGIGFEIERVEKRPAFRWTGKSSLTAARALANAKSQEERADQHEAEAFLREALKNGEREAKEVEREANQQGITPKQLRTARQKIGLTFNKGIRREGFGKEQKSFWSLPDTDAQTDNTNAHKIENGHLCGNDGNKTSSSNDLATNAQNQEDGHLCDEKRHLSEETLTPSDGKLFDDSPEDNKTENHGEDFPLYYTFSCWKCNATVSNEDSICPNCEQDLNEPPF